MRKIFDFLELFVGVAVTLISFFMDFSFPLFSPILGILGFTFIIEGLEQLYKKSDGN